MFKVISLDGQARSGLLNLSHGVVRLPAFMPVGTAASIKGLTRDMVEEISADIILGNVYHLMLNNTADKIAYFGGLHSFMGWSKPILTDSGGFQVMSLSGLRKMTEEGVKFASYVDGSRYFLTPEESIRIQHCLGSDITMVLDECIAYPATYRKTKKAMALSLRWAKRSKEAFIKRDGYMIFGIVQGGMFKDLRQSSVEGLTDLGFDGYAIGGLAVGEGLEKMIEVLDYTVPLLPPDKPRYVMGIGKPIDIVSAVAKGVDMFDCVLPTRNARNGQVYTRNGEVRIRQAKYALIKEPLDTKCRCYTCQNHSIGYLHHLYRYGEMLSSTLLTIHNLTFYQDMMEAIRNAIKMQRFHSILEATQAGNYQWV